MSILITIAGIITPLGLYEEFVSSRATDTPFQYSKDISAFGYGTPPRINLSFSRQCFDALGLAPCPFSASVPVVAIAPFSLSNASILTNYTWPYGYDVNVPQILMDIYTSGTGNNTTISNFFDIQYRQYSSVSNLDFNNGSTYETGAFQFMETLVLNNAYLPVEGLIVHMINGGIGFRNHTFPPGFQYNVVWTEDILFVEPETVCVDTNLTIDFTVSPSLTTINPSANIQNLVLVDRGVFVNLDRTAPEVNVSNPQQNPDLFTRAYTGAWWNNYYAALYYNITDYTLTNNSTTAFRYVDSFINQTFPLPPPSSTSPILNTLQFTTNYGDYLFLDDITSPSTYLNATITTGNLTSNYTLPSLFQGPPNPFNISTSNLTDICKSLPVPKCRLF